MSNAIVAIGENGYRFALIALEEDAFGYVLVKFAFNLPWCSGGFELQSSKEALDRFVQQINNSQNDTDEEIIFLSHEGNLEVKVRPRKSGQLDIVVLGIPNMAMDDRIEFEFEGSILETAGQAT
jgi:hypothetical protein